MELETELIRRIDDAALSCNERAWLRCELARRLEEAGHYEAAKEALSEFWGRVGERPNVEGLDRRTAAEILLRVGVLFGWIGSTRQIADAQEKAKDLITESIHIFEEIGDSGKVSEALTDLGYCYWREGAFDEARVTLQSAITRAAEEDTYLKAIALLRSAMVERSSTRFGDALRIHQENAPLVEASGSHALKGKYHNELATVLKDLGAAEGREDHIDRALVEYAAASYHFEQAGHVRYRACVENNLGYLFLTARRFAEAHEHLDRARALLVSLEDKTHTAQVDETRARAFLAEGRNAEAEEVVRAAARMLEQGGEQSVLAEALTTHGAALARLGRHARARAVLQRAIEVAERVGDLEGAGQAALTIVEELGDHLPISDLADTYERASELLEKSQHPGLLARLNAGGRRLLRALTRPPTTADEFRPSRSWHRFSFWPEVRRYEAYLIERALKETGGVVTRAARLLGFKHHHSLIALINSRHKQLLSARSEIIPRRRSSLPRPSRPPQNAPAKEARTVRILHVEDEKAIAEPVKAALEDEGWEVVTCADGTEARRRISGREHYDLLLLDNQLPGVSGIELLRHARSLPHRRRTPVIMLSASEVETEAWRAGAGAFLRKPDDMRAIASTIKRLLKSRT
jgi:CheY-like chemotaxis protein/Tfp pilus assembly protein PilF